MKKLLLSCFAFLPVVASAQGTCNEAGNLLIYSNYDGGDITIDIDQDIPDIRIGICSYEAIDIEITGDYVDNVTQVLYAGYDSGSGTSISGVDAAITDILLYPPATIDDPDGYPYIICAYDCDTDYVPGGCNTVEQVTDYFQVELGGTLRYSFMQYGVWSGGDYLMSEGGNCCYGAPTECFIDITAGKDPVICSGENTLLVASGGDTYTWSPMDGIDCSGDCATVTASPAGTTTYIITGTDSDGCFGYDTITVYVDPTPEASITVSNDTAYASGGVSYQWLLDGVVLPGENGVFIVAPETGNYSVIVTSAQGCSDTSATATVVVEQPQGLADLWSGIQVYPVPTDAHINIEWNSNLPIAQCLLFDQQGKLIHRTTPTQQNSCTIPVESLEAGVYLLQIDMGGKLMRRSVVIQ